MIPYTQQKHTKRTERGDRPDERLAHAGEQGHEEEAQAQEEACWPRHWGGVGVHLQFLGGYVS